METMQTCVLKFIVATVLLVVTLAGCSSDGNNDVSMESLLDEMLSAEEMARYPAFHYKAGALAGQLGTKSATEILLDVRGPGVVTRLLIDAVDSKGVVKFFFNGSTEPAIVLQSLDLRQSDFPADFIIGNNTLFLPLPYSQSCRIIYEREEAAADKASKRYFQIDYRTYTERGTSVETFSANVLSKLSKKIEQAAQKLKEAVEPKEAELVEKESLLRPGDPLVSKLPAGPAAIYELKVQVTQFTGGYEQAMRDIILQFRFDGLQTVRVPLSDFSGGGMSGANVKSRYLEADGHGSITSRWLMPYREEASIALINEGLKTHRVRYSIAISPIQWDERMLYFHASWSEQAGILKDTLVTSIRGGRGVYRGSALALYNYTANIDWMRSAIRAQADESSFASLPSAWLNASYNAAVFSPVASHTLFGGMTAMETRSGSGYNSYLRLQSLDAVPFTDSLKFVVDRSGVGGRMDIARTLFWYGDNKVRPDNPTVPAFQSRLLHPSHSAAPFVPE